MKTAAILIYNVNCVPNMLLKLRIEDYLKANDYRIVDSDTVEDSDLVILCGCGYDKGKQEKGIGIIEEVNTRIKKETGDTEFIITGCVLSIDKDTIDRIHNGQILGFGELNKLDDVIDADIPFSEIPERHEIKDADKQENFVENRWQTLKTHISGWMLDLRSILTLKPKTYAYYHDYDSGDDVWCVRTSTGCLRECSYCSIKFSKGKLKSRDPGEIISEVKKGVQKGYKWISLIADDNGCYGMDIGTDISELLLELNKIGGNFNILVDNLSPRPFIDVYENATEIFDSGKFSRALIAIQHVNERVLRSMHRYYDKERLRECLVDLQSNYPSFILNSHFIVGYPGETEEEFQEMYDFAEFFLGLNPSNSFLVFPFSSNPGTEAAELPNHIDKFTKWRRVTRLNKLLVKTDYKLIKEQIKKDNSSAVKKFFLNRTAEISFAMRMIYRSIFWS